MYERIDAVVTPTFGK